MNVKKLHVQHLQEDQDLKEDLSLQLVLQL